MFNLDDVAFARKLLRTGNEVSQMMKVVGEEGTSIDDFVVYLKSEYLDSVYLQQDAFDEVDAATAGDRQKYVFARILKILKTRMNFTEKDEARLFFQKLTQSTKDWNRIAIDKPAFKQAEEGIEKAVAEVTDYA